MKKIMNRSQMQHQYAAAWLRGEQTPRAGLCEIYDRGRISTILGWFR